MGNPANLGLVDRNGSPLEARIQRVLQDLLPRFKRTFADLDDEAIVAEVLEEAGRRIIEHERLHGRIEKLHGYAWVALRSVAVSRLRRPSAKLAQATLGSEESEAVLGATQADFGSPERIERELLLREALEELTEEERRICIWKVAGFSTKEIARHRGSSITAVDTKYHRAIKRIRDLLTGRAVATERREAVDSPDEDATSPSAKTEREGRKRR